MDITTESCRVFVDKLASAEPAPGGGGAAALVGAIGTALGHMVSNLTIGKKKYAAVRAELLALNERFAHLEQALLNQVEGDELGFLPLAAAYSLPKDTPDYEKIMEDAKRKACDAPLTIMSLCCQALDAIGVAAAKGSRLVVSDAACGAVCCKAAMQAASVTVFINTKSMTDRATAEEINARVHEMLEIHGSMADQIYDTICGQFGQ